MITLEDIKTTQDKLTAMIAAFERQPTFPVTIRPPQLKEGERHLATVISACGKIREHIILLPGEAPPADQETQMKLAASIGGELFDRVEGAMLNAIMNDEFKPEAYWTRERHAADAGWGWCQYFLNGLQNDYGDVSCELRARAVRREPIE